MIILEVDGNNEDRTNILHLGFFRSYEVHNINESSSYTHRQCWQQIEILPSIAKISSSLLFVITPYSGEIRGCGLWALFAPSLIPPSTICIEEDSCIRCARMLPIIPNSNAFPMLVLSPSHVSVVAIAVLVAMVRTKNHNPPPSQSNLHIHCNSRVSRQETTCRQKSSLPSLFRLQ